MFGHSCYDSHEANRWFSTFKLPLLHDFRDLICSYRFHAVHFGTKHLGLLCMPFVEGLGLTI